jgi:hypothetical protein
MFGHWVGSCAEVAIKINICCSLPTKYKDLCDGSTVFIHELLVEPIADALIYTMLNKAIRYMSPKIAEPSDDTMYSLFAGAVASLYLSKVTELIPSNFKPQFVIDYGVWVETVLSLPGNYIGGNIYKVIAKTNELAAITTFGSLLVHKVYTNLYLQEGKVGDNSCKASGELLNPWDDSCLAPEEQPIITEYIT